MTAQVEKYFAFLRDLPYILTVFDFCVISDGWLKVALLIIKTWNIQYKQTALAANQTIRVSLSLN